MVESRIRVLMAKKISNTADENELAELNDLLSSFPAYQLLYKVLSQVKTNIKETPDEKEIAIQLTELWKKINHAKAEQSIPVIKVSRFTSYRKWIAAAAVLVAVITASILVNHKINKTALAFAANYRTIKVPYGKTSRVILSDGTVVKLNAGTTLSFPLAFAKDSREVKLEGEAFFEVTKNPKRPFLVHAGHLTVRVLGTAFNVKAYREDKEVETTLIHGKVQVVMDNHPDKKIILLPHQKLTVVKDPVEGKPQASSEPAETKYKLQAVIAQADHNIDEVAWLDHKVAFSNQSFEEVANVIERKYNVHLIFGQDQLKNELITGVFESEKLSEALRLLQMSTDFNYTIKGDQITLSTNSKHQ